MLCLIKEYGDESIYTVCIETEVLRCVCLVVGRSGVYTR